MPKNRCWILIALFVASTVLFLTYDIESHYALIIKLRAVKWWGLVIVGTAVGIATLLFQTLTQNDILTPQIIGFDALFILLQTILLFALGGNGFIALGPITKFSLALILMSFSALLLFAPMIRQLDLTRLILVGIIFSLLFRSIAMFLQRMIAPEDYLILQSQLFASLDNINTQLLSIASVIILVLLIVVWKMRFVLDVLLLGRHNATGLGINYKRQSYLVIVVVSVFIATATALAGPMAFLGLLVCVISNQLVTTMRHSVRIPVVIVISALTLVIGQWLFEHILTMKSTLSVVVDSVGGIAFLWLIRNKLGKQY